MSLVICHGLSATTLKVKFDCASWYICSLAIYVSSSPRDSLDLNAVTVTGLHSGRINEDCHRFHFLGGCVFGEAKLNVLRLIKLLFLLYA